jgi:hypothetical protein
MKKILFSLILIALLFGCTAPIPGINDEAAITEFKKIRSDYGMEQGFNPDQSQMNNYLNKLSVFRGAIGFGEAGRVVEAEIDSATAFFYLVKAMSESNSLDFYNLNCKDIKISNTIDYADAAMKNADDAALKINALSPGALSNLRENQLEAVLNYRQSAEQIKIAINELC